jgi:uncharacterized MnhB-related membrane protein
VKVFCLLFFYVWMRWTLPRYRYDQLMEFGWKWLLPVALLNLLATAALVLWLGLEVSRVAADGAPRVAPQGPLPWQVLVGPSTTWGCPRTGPAAGFETTSRRFTVRVRVMVKGKAYEVRVTVAFWIFAAIAVIASLGVVGQRNPMHSVMLLIVSFGALAGLYVLLDAPFTAVTQIIIYAGAIMVLFLFVVMLLNAPREEAGAAVAHRAARPDRHEDRRRPVGGVRGAGHLGALARRHGLLQRGPRPPPRSARCGSSAR